MKEVTGIPLQSCNIYNATDIFADHIRPYNNSIKSNKNVLLIKKIVWRSVETQSIIVHLITDVKNEFL